MTRGYNDSKRNPNTPFGYCHCGCGRKTNIAKRTSAAQGTIKGQPRLFLQGHRYYGEDIERFMAFVRKTESCWLWTGHKRGRKGAEYGAFKLNHRTLGAHVASYMLNTGLIDAGKVVCHTCDTPLCVNPAHLFLATQEENMQDMVRKNRHRAVTKPESIAKGEDHHNSKLTNDNVLDIVRRAKLGESAHQICKEFDTNAREINRILNGKRWSWLTGITDRSCLEPLTIQQGDYFVKFRTKGEYHYAFLGQEGTKTPWRRYALKLTEEEAIREKNRILSMGAEFDAVIVSVSA